MDNLKIVVFSAILLICAILAYRYPRQGLWAFLIYLPFEGTLEHRVSHVYPNPFLQLAKDSLYIPALIAILQTYRRERRSLPTPRFVLLTLAILIGLALLTLVFVNGRRQLFANGDEQPLLMGIWGFKVLIGYIPLVLCAQYLIRNRQDLNVLMRLTLVVIMVACSLALIQYLLLRTGYCGGSEGQGYGLFRATLSARCFVGGSLLYSPSQGQIRLPGPFVSPWQWGWFLICSVFFTFSATFSDSRRGWRVLGLIACFMTVATSVLTGQPIAAVVFPIILILLTLLTRPRMGLSSFISIGLGATALLVALLLINPAFVQQPFDYLRNRWAASPPYLFIGHQLAWAFSSMDGWLGSGLGRATNSARIWGNVSFIETYYAKLLYEIGPLGLLAFLALVTSLARATWRAYRRLRDRRLRNYGGVLWVFVLLISYNTYQYPLDVNPVAVYYWFFAGVILALPELEQPVSSE